MLALLIMAFFLAGPHPNPPFLLEVKVVGVRDLRPTLQKLYIVVGGHHREKLALICADNKMLVMGSGESAQLGFTVGDIKKALKINGENFGSVTLIVHNHDRGESPSPADFAAAEAFKAAGFRGRSLIYDVQTGQLKPIR